MTPFLSLSHNATARAYGILWLVCVVVVVFLVGLHHYYFGKLRFDLLQVISESDLVVLLCLIYQVPLSIKPTLIQPRHITDPL